MWDQARSRSSALGQTVDFQESRTPWFSVKPECNPLGLAVWTIVISTSQQVTFPAYHIEILSGDFAGVCNVIDIAVYQDLFAIQLRVSVIDLSVAQSTMDHLMCGNLPLSDDGALLQPIIDIRQNSPYTSCQR